MSLAEMGDDASTDYRARQMGFAFQLYDLVPVLSSVDNVDLPVLVSGVGSREARKRALNAIDMVGLADRAAHRPSQLSGGQRQRVTVARALVNNPSIIWADEPTGDLDSETAQEIVDLILDLNKRNRQTFVSHAQEIGDQCDRIVRMRDGLIVDDGSSPG